MILGSHNSFTYLKPKHWYMRLFTLFAKCQSKDIFEQYNAGARYFDLRIRFKNGNAGFKDIIVAHGLMEYKIDWDDLYFILNKLNNIASNCKETIYIRLLYEMPSRDKSKDAKDKINKFIDICYKLVNWFPSLKFCGGQRKYDWKQLATLEPHPNSIDLYSSRTWKIWDDWCPKIYASFMNTKNYHKYKDAKPKNGYMLMDFVNNIKK